MFDIGFMKTNIIVRDHTKNKKKHMLGYSFEPLCPIIDQRMVFSCISMH